MFLYRFSWTSTLVISVWEDKAGKPMLFALSMRTLNKVTAPFIFVPFISTNPTNSFNLITTPRFQYYGSMAVC